MAVFVIGDSHGHSEVLRKLIEVSVITESDTLVCLGDYVDKGPDVSGTLDFLIELDRRWNCIFLRGNHDQMLLDAIEDPEKIAIWECLAGEAPLTSYGDGPESEILASFPEKHLNFLKNTCVDYYETEQWIFVHGGISAFVAPENEDSERLHWSSLRLAQAHGSGKKVICGHTANKNGEIVDLGHTLCVDTGIAKGQYLCCLNLSDGSYVKVNAELEVVRGMTG